MEGLPASIGNSGDDGVLAQSQQQPSKPLVNGGGGGGGGGADELGDDGGAIGGGFTEDGDRNSGGNRWPKQETLALINIRSEMDAAFRDSNLKGPLWDDVSRKLSELGFHRSAKKCREKFENVYKYHRRTKEGRTSKPDKIYRFSDQLQALEQNPRSAFPPQPFPAVKPPPVMVNMSNNVTVPSPFITVTGADQNNVSPISVAAPAAVMAVMPPQPVMNQKRTFPFSQPNMSGSTNSATSSDTFSDDEPPQKKRKWQDFFGKLMKEVIEKQEELQKRFLDTIERRERDRVAREEAWRAQEIAKMNQEHDRLVKERSIAAAKDAAVITFLQKMTGKNPDTVDETRKRLADFLAPPIPLASTLPIIQQQQIHQTPPPPPPPRHEILQVAVPPSPMVKNLDGDVSGGDNMLLPSPSRWPKAEINALITLRTQLDMNYQENTAKGPLWEEISAAMRKLGYNRNAKRCKEKWENINKYYKKMKDGNKKRPEDSKTCPYFHQLDAIYREKATAIVARPEQQWPPATMVQEKTPPPPPQQQQSTNGVYVEKRDDYPGFTGKPETQTAPVVAWPQQQWRVPAALQETQQQPQPQSAADMEDQGSENTDDYDDDDDEDEDKEEEGGGYEIVASKISSVATV